MERGWRNIQHICDIVEKDTNGVKPVEGAEPGSADFILLKEFNSMTLNLFRKPDAGAEEEEEEEDGQIKS